MTDNFDGFDVVKMSKDELRAILREAWECGAGFASSCAYGSYPTKSRKDIMNDDVENLIPHR